MKDKITLRLLAVQELEKFNELMKKSRKNKRINQIIEELYGVKIREIELPLHFEFIIHNNLRFKFEEVNEPIAEGVELDWDENFKDISKQYEPSIEEIVPDWDKIYQDINEAYNEEDNINFFDIKDLSKIKYNSFITTKKSTLILLLLKECFIFINEFFNIVEYGLPQKDLIFYLLNLIINKDIEITEKKIHVNLNNDIYSILLRYEIDFLSNELSKRGVNIKAIKEQSGFNDERKRIEAVINKSPIYNLIVNPFINASEIKESASSLTKSIKKLNEKYFSSYYISSNKFNTIKDYCELYIDLRLNKEMSYSIISQKLEKRGIYRDQNLVQVQIKELCEATGLIEMEKKIKRYASYNRKE